MARPAAPAADDRSAVDALVPVLFREEAGSLARLTRFFVDDERLQRTLPRGVHPTGPVGAPHPRARPGPPPTSARSCSTWPATTTAAALSPCTLKLPVVGIAETLGLSANSVKTHMQRGLRALEVRLEVKSE